MSKTIVACSHCGKNHFVGSEKQRRCQLDAAKRNSRNDSLIQKSPRRDIIPKSDQLQDMECDDIAFDIIESHSNIPGMMNLISYHRDKLQDYANVGIKWSEAEKDSLNSLATVHQIIEEDGDIKSAENEKDSMEKGTFEQKLNYWGQPSERQPRLQHLKNMAEIIVDYHQQKDEPLINASPREHNSSLISLSDAQDALWDKDRFDYSYSDMDLPEGMDLTTIRETVIDSYVEGNVQDYHSDYTFAADKKMLKDFSENQKMYLSYVFPDKELKATMDTRDIKDVTTGSFFNGREQGLVYTVTDPEGQSYSFSVYEHRNSDTIIINGAMNWDGEDLPYIGNDKYTYFYEADYHHYDDVADQLCSYLESAQHGQLDMNSLKNR